MQISTNDLTEKQNDRKNINKEEQLDKMSSDRNISTSPSSPPSPPLPQSKSYQPNKSSEEEYNIGSKSVPVTPELTLREGVSLPPIERTCSSVVEETIKPNIHVLDDNPRVEDTDVKDAQVNANCDKNSNNINDDTNTHVQEKITTTFSNSPQVNATNTSSRLTGLKASYKSQFPYTLRPHTNQPYNKYMPSRNNYNSASQRKSNIHTSIISSDKTDKHKNQQQQQTSPVFQMSDLERMMRAASVFMDASAINEFNEARMSSQKTETINNNNNNNDESEKEGENAVAHTEDITKLETNRVYSPRDQMHSFRAFQPESPPIKLTSHNGEEMLMSIGAHDDNLPLYSSLHTLRQNAQSTSNNAPHTLISHQLESELLPESRASNKTNAMRTSDTEKKDVMDRPMPNNSLPHITKPTQYTAFQEIHPHDQQQQQHFLSVPISSSHTPVTSKYDNNSNLNKANNTIVDHDKREVGRAEEEQNYNISSKDEDDELDVHSESSFTIKSSGNDSRNVSNIFTTEGSSDSDEDDNEKNNNERHKTNKCTHCTKTNKWNDNTPLSLQENEHTQLSATTQTTITNNNVEDIANNNNNNNKKKKDRMNTNVNHSEHYKNDDEHYKPLQQNYTTKTPPPSSLPTFATSPHGNVSNPCTCTLSPEQKASHNLFARYMSFDAKNNNIMNSNSSFINMDNQIAGLFANRHNNSIIMNNTNNYNNNNYNNSIIGLNLNSSFLNNYSLLKDPLSASMLGRHGLNKELVLGELIKRREKLKRMLKQLQHEATERSIFAIVRTSNASQLQYLLQEELCNVNEVDYNGCTPLHVAASEGNLTIVRVLLSYGADVFARDKFGRTPLDCAASNRHGGVGRYLLAVLRAKHQQQEQEKQLEEKQLQQAQQPEYEYYEEEEQGPREIVADNDTTNSKPHVTLPNSNNMTNITIKPETKGNIGFDGVATKPTSQPSTLHHDNLQENKETPAVTSQKRVSETPLIKLEQEEEEEEEYEEESLQNLIPPLQENKKDHHNATRKKAKDLVIDTSSKADVTNVNTHNKLAEADEKHDDTIITNNNNLNTWDVNSLSTPMQSHWYTQRVNRSNSSTPTQPITNTAVTSISNTFNTDHNTNTMNSSTDNSTNVYSSEDNIGAVSTRCSNENTNNYTSFTTTHNNNNNNTSSLTHDDSHTKSLTVTLATPSEQSTTFDPINSSFIDLTGSALLNDYKQQQQRPSVEHHTHELLSPIHTQPCPHHSRYLHPMKELQLESSKAQLAQDTEQPPSELLLPSTGSGGTLLRAMKDLEKEQQRQPVSKESNKQQQRQQKYENDANPSHLLLADQHQPHPQLHRPPVPLYGSVSLSESLETPSRTANTNNTARQSNKIQNMLESEEGEEYEHQNQLLDKNGKVYKTDEHRRLMTVSDPTTATSSLLSGSINPSTQFAPHTQSNSGMYSSFHDMGAQTLEDYHKDTALLLMTNKSKPMKPDTDSTVDIAKANTIAPITKNDNMSCDTNVDNLIANMASENIEMVNPTNAATANKEVKKTTDTLSVANVETTSHMNEHANQDPVQNTQLRELQTQSYSSHTTISDTTSLVVCMVGLPGRGKSFISKRLVRYMNWKGVPCKVFNAGQYRRQLLGATATSGAEFFDPQNPKGAELREKMAELACEGVVKFLGIHELAVGILDATNTTTRRRKWLKEYFAQAMAAQNHTPYRLLFIESVCTDEAIITENILRSKCENDDFKGVKNTSAVIAEFRDRILQYEKVYEPLDPSEGVSFIKIINVKRHVVLHKVHHGLGSRIAFFLLNLHPVAFPIYIALPGETIGDQKHVFGGDERLTYQGEEYARALKQFIQDRFVPNMVILHATNNSVLHTLRPLLEDEVINNDENVQLHTPVMDSRGNKFNSTNAIIMNNNNFNNNNNINYVNRKEDNSGSNAASSVAGMTSMSDTAINSVATKSSGTVTSVPSVHLQGLTPTNASVTNSNLNLITNTTNNNNATPIDTTTTGTTLLPIPPPPHKLVYSSGPSQAPLPSATGGGMNTKHHLPYLLRKESDHVLPMTTVNPIIHNTTVSNNNNNSNAIINTLHAGEPVVIKHPHGLVPPALESVSHTHLPTHHDNETKDNKVESSHGKDGVAFHHPIGDVGANVYKMDRVSTPIDKHTARFHRLSANTTPHAQEMAIHGPTGLHSHKSHQHNENDIINAETHEESKDEQMHSSSYTNIDKETNLGDSDNNNDGDDDKSQKDHETEAKKEIDECKSTSHTQDHKEDEESEEELSINDNDEDNNEEEDDEEDEDDAADEVLCPVPGLDNINYGRFSGHTASWVKQRYPRLSSLLYTNTAESEYNVKRNVPTPTTTINALPPTMPPPPLLPKREKVQSGNNFTENNSSTHTTNVDKANNKASNNNNKMLRPASIGLTMSSVDDVAAAEALLSEVETKKKDELGGSASRGKFRNANTSNANQLADVSTAAANEANSKETTNTVNEVGPIAVNTVVNNDKNNEDNAGTTNSTGEAFHMTLKNALRYFQQKDSNVDPHLAYCVQFPNGESCRQVNVRLEPALMAVMRTQSSVFVIAPAIPAQGMLAFFADVIPELSPTLRLPRHCVVEIGVKDDITVHPLLLHALPPNMTPSPQTSPVVNMDDATAVILSENASQKK